MHSSASATLDHYIDPYDRTTLYLTLTCVHGTTTSDVSALVEPGYQHDAAIAEHVYQSALVELVQAHKQAYPACLDCLRATLKRFVAVPKEVASARLN